MAGPGCIVFSHANSFPAGTYRVLFEAWREAGHEVHAIEKLGHDEHYRVTDNWPLLRNQLIAFIEQHASAGPVWLVGHSLGGFLSVLAASKRPDLARGIVLMDSPLIGGLLARTLQVAKATGIGKRFSPGHVSKRRRQHWPSPEAAFAHFEAKPAFARWAPGVLRDYIAAGIEPSGHGQSLSFRREVETQIYYTLPHHIPRLLVRRPLGCPMAFIGGTQSAEVRQVGMKATERFTQGRISWIEGSHLFPFEQPGQAAAEVLRWLGEFEQRPETTRL
jgi:pimeloyl-ACP methyl ester carboxylesterase